MVRRSGCSPVLALVAGEVFQLGIRVGGRAAFRDAGDMADRLREPIRVLQSRVNWQPALATGPIVAITKDQYVDRLVL